MEITDKEKEQLLYQVKKRYGYDFTNYSEASIKRRINRFCEIHKFDQYFDLKHHLLNEAGLFSEFVLQVTVNITEMFRDPSFFRSLKENVFPQLATYPHSKIWHAGCSTGEEVYSLKIMLLENNLRNNSVYATDINPEVLQQAREATYNMKLMKDYTKQYINAGGISSFSDYYTAHYNMAILKSELRENVIFSVHNLVSDGSFNEFNLIVCRNVLIYFNSELQERVLNLFYQSLPPLGYLALGSKETLAFSSLKNKFEVVDKNEKIYRKID
jgi:chemotaxis protein methyltransferase CheR